MARTLPASLAVLAALLLSGCSNGAAPGGDGGTGGDGGAGEATLLDAPKDPAVGMRWDFRSSGITTGNSTNEVKAHEERAGHAAFRVEGTQRSAGATVQFTSWNRRSDGASVESRTVTQVPHVGTVTSNTTYDPPCAWVRYPVVEGDAYEVTCTFTTSTSLNPSPMASTQTAAIEVMGKESVTVAAGTFQTAKVRKTLSDGTMTDTYYLLDGCGLAKSVTTRDGQQSVTELVATTCS